MALLLAASVAVSVTGYEPIVEIIVPARGFCDFATVPPQLSEATMLVVKSGSGAPRIPVRLVAQVVIVGGVVSMSTSAMVELAGVAVAYFVPPQVWAWRPWRVRLIRRVVSLVLAVFPFEIALYRRAGVPVAFVGHPVLDALAEAPSRAEARKELGVDGDAPVVGLLPGSRRHEVAGVLPMMRAAAGRIVGAHPDARFLVARAPTVDAAELGDEGGPPLRIVVFQILGGRNRRGAVLRRRILLVLRLEHRCRGDPAREVSRL